MPFELKLALKYFRSRRKSLVRFTSVIAVVGIAAGVASLIIANAIAKGFSDEMQNKVLNNTSHITIYNEGNTIVSNWEIITQNVKRIKNVESIEPTTYESAIISTDKNASYAVLRVQSSGSRVQSSEFRVQSLESKSEPRAVAGEVRSEQIADVSIGKELADKIKLKIGDQASIITLENEENPTTSTVHIKDIFETGLYEYDSTWIFVDEINYLKLIESVKFEPKVFSVSVTDIYKANETADMILQKIGDDFRVLDWQEANKPLFAALSLERKVALAIILLIIFIAVLNITTTLSLLVNERRLDIAVLRTCGAKTRSIVTVFLFEGIILSLLGICLGVIIGLLVCLAGNYFKVISLSKEVYSLNYIPFNVDFESILIIICMTFLLSFVAIFYPALKASRIKPIENLRMQ